MSHISPDITLATRLETLQIAEYEDEIFQMSYYKLRKYFSYDSGGLHTSRLIRNLIWQDYQLIKAGKLEKLDGNIRSYWYERLKPLLDRAKARDRDEKYDMMIESFAQMVRDWHLFSYRDFGFRDAHRPYRLIGTHNPHVIVVAEKAGLFDFLQRLWADFGVTVMAFTGQPSILSTEYLLRALRRSGVDLHRDIPVFTILDFDPAGYSIGDNFINNQLIPLGYHGQITRIDLAHPGLLTPEELQFAKVQIKGNESMIDNWITKEGGGLHPYGIGVDNVEGPVYGLQADALLKKIRPVFAGLVAPYLEMAGAQVVQRRLSNQLIDVLQQVYLTRIFGKRRRA